LTKLNRKNTIIILGTQMKNVFAIFLLAGVLMGCKKDETTQPISE